MNVLRKYVILAFIGFAIFLLVAAANSTPKIAVVDIAKAAQEYRKMKELNEKYKRDYQFYKEKLDEIQKEIEALKAKGASQEEIAEKQREYLQKKQLFEGMLQQEYNPKIQQVFNEVVEKAKEFAEEKGIDILIGQGVVYAKKDYDLTESFIEYLNSGK